MLFNFEYLSEVVLTQTALVDGADSANRLRDAAPDEVDDGPFRGHESPSLAVNGAVGPRFRPVRLQAGLLHPLDLSFRLEGQT